MWYPHSLVLSVLLGLLGASAAADTDSFEAACAAFGDKINIENVTFGFTEYVPAGSNISLTDIPSVCQTTAQQVAVDLCRVYTNVSTSDRSGIRLESWFPRTYNGRFLSTGNGGLAGCIQYTDLAFGTEFGFATVGANNGHDGDTGIYFLNNSEVLADFAYRSVHTGVEVGKQLTDLFYDEGYNTSYYIGCSTGGREGYKSAQAFPDDFDGILAGSAAMNFVNLATWGMYLYYLTGPANASTFLTPTQWAVVNQEVLRQCDTLDGAQDGIIEDPDLCWPVIETLICNGTESPDTSPCITGTQAQTVNSVFQDFYGPDGTEYYPRLNPGGELIAAYVYLGGTPFAYSYEWYQDVVYSDPSWDPNSWTLEEAKVALDQNPFNIETFDPDLSGFRDSGGKILSYHGTADPIITSGDTKWYYRKVADAMDIPPSEIDEFYRFFPIGGMGHCGTGTGAWYIGQSAGTYLASEPENNLLLALVDWVENGVAPEYVRGSTSSDGVTAEWYRKHCRYPKRNVYVGPGNWTDENAWSCV
ncbi:feruloyl esterase B [Xylariales sp. PMI_506]|nr:feruloyl esterase B [Xylariales sp. PMI_506]